MARRDADSMQPDPVSTGTAKSGSPFLVPLVVLLIIVGIVDALLWALLVFCALGGGLPSPSSGGAVPSAAVSDGGVSGASDDASDNASDDSDEKRKALEDYIQKVAGIGQLETEMLESFNSAREMDDAAMYAEITENTLPLCQQMNDKILEISSDDSEIGDLCKMHRDYATEMLNALTMLTSALENQDAAQVTEANDRINAANDLVADYTRALQKLADERGVSLGI